MVGYIYMTTNLINGKIYIGQHQGRKFDPRYLGSGKLLIKSINRYDKNNFIVEVLHKCDSFSMLNQKEIYYIKKYDSTNPDIGYNISFGGDVWMRGVKMSEETKEKNRRAHLGKKASEEAKEKNRQAQLGRKHSKSTREKMSISGKGKKHKKFSQYTRDKMSKSHLGLVGNRKGCTLTEEHKAKLSAIMKKLGNKPPSNKGKKWSDEVKEKIRKGNLGKCVSEETREKLRKANLGKIASEETKRKMSLSMKKKYEKNNA